MSRFWRSAFAIDGRTVSRDRGCNRSVERRSMEAMTDLRCLQQVPPDAVPHRLSKHLPGARVRPFAAQHPRDCHLGKPGCPGEVCGQPASRRDVLLQFGDVEMLCSHTGTENRPNRSRLSTPKFNAANFFQSGASRLIGVSKRAGRGAEVRAFGRALKMIRERQPKRRASQDAIVSALADQGHRMAKSTLSRYEAGRIPEVPHLLALSRVYGLDWRAVFVALVAALDNPQLTASALFDLACHRSAVQETLPSTGGSNDVPASEARILELEARVHFLSQAMSTLRASALHDIELISATVGSNERA